MLSTRKHHMTPPVDLDMDGLLERCQGSAAALAKLLDLCMSQAVRDTDALRAAMDRWDANGVMISAHNLRGMASLIGADRLRELSELIEDSGEADDLPAVRQSGDQLEQEVERCMNMLRTMASDVQSRLQRGEA